MQMKSHQKIILLEMESKDGAFQFSNSIQDALDDANNELFIIQETMHSIDGLKADCDKLDYAIAAGAGALCGLIDIFLVGRPGETSLGDISDKWFGERTKDFAKLCGWNSKKNESLSSAIRYLERKFKIPYDQRGAGDAATFVFGLTPTNHHFISLGHNPTILGLFFSILDQFTNASHFVSGGELMALTDADDRFILRGNSVPSKLFCGIINWFGHLISDISGSSGSKGRGMGIPSPILAWTNDIIAIRRVLNISTKEFDRSMNDLAVEIYEKGFDVRFQATQMIPVVINELIVRFFYSTRRMIKYYTHTVSDERSFREMWSNCEPFSNPTIKRMLTVAHGAFCLLDLSDATVRGVLNGGGSFNIVEFCMRINIAGVGRFTVSLYGETKRGIYLKKLEKDVVYAKKERIIVEHYIESLKQLAAVYGDETLGRWADDITASELYKQSFQRTAEVAQKVGVPEKLILKSKEDIDCYFLGER